MWSGGKDIIDALFHGSNPYMRYNSTDFVHDAIDNHEQFLPLIDQCNAKGVDSEIKFTTLLGYY
jgi:hypothetical protein